MNHDSFRSITILFAERIQMQFKGSGSILNANHMSVDSYVKLYKIKIIYGLYITAL